MTDTNEPNHIQTLVYSFNLEPEEKTLMWQKFEEYIYTSAVRYLYEALSEKEVEIFNKIGQTAPEGDSMIMLVAEHPELKGYYEKALAQSYADVLALLEAAVTKFGSEESHQLLATIKGQ
ncbi:MAG: hypothetical protein UZ21_OP11001000210 [Microgenomates bacterium OLB22]|nr:MAG: hypothetical protein UZ21_OP11001000210 [Microgenomates bacterium OLB22]